MAVEIELKVRIDFPDEIKTRFSSFAAYCCKYEKSDTYWYFPDSDYSKLRVRQELKTTAEEQTSRSIVTCKTREMRGGIEVNDEKEFTVSDREIFEELLRKLGLQAGIKKQKRGWAWEYREESFPPVLAELSEVLSLDCTVKPLGWFLELEITGSTFDEDSIGQYREHLLNVLKKLKIPIEKIECRPYSELLARGC